MNSIPTLEGAGVNLKRAFGYYQLPMFDPFLLLDDFHSDNPRDYLKGFPWHPHRGIETITYVLEGNIEHGDSLGNRGLIGPGDVQWMTAGGGIVHQEMPKGRKDGLLQGFQLWANLPARSKMMTPRYRDIKRDQIPEVTTGEDVKIKIICGKVDNVFGPALDIVIEPEFLDVTIPAGKRFVREIPSGHTVIAYGVAGRGVFDRGQDGVIGPERVVLFDAEGTVNASALDEDFRFLLISGKPIREPVAWGGPIVMNTEAELKIAFEEYDNGTFLKHGAD
jgi:redox-sensitive bicupin YhaK (pirin superfamily)